MSQMSFIWTLGWAGSADCTISDGHSEGRVHVSYISRAPENLLDGVTRIVLGARLAKVQFEGEPAATRWIFRRYGEHLDIDVLHLEDERHPESDGQILWQSCRQPVDSLARSIVEGFDRVAIDPGEDAYRKKWLSPFPRTELEDLRTAWRNAFPSTSASSDESGLPTPSNL
ncbi:hypothetical protein ABIA33_007441 [Streptacidiphilus sp. MAP12-16]|uniref:hypothetical protein n=1 Tax=Streptacidiphilus sp. MAP12-16 TaxID=3156300 RepID=UPI0035155121